MKQYPMPVGDLRGNAQDWDGCFGSRAGFWRILPDQKGELVNTVSVTESKVTLRVKIAPINKPSSVKIHTRKER